ncbi:NAD-dependent succinate-semialdehyde dehydrogenase [Halopenitus persicus]|uniref:NAD-dependent succinate-semialdehyde dehydrogenase n=1 Tax=Halopenitus persicus TaxID=1048396 RepID=UPI000BBA4E04|nr:NAD-dependent succinate-semialdehyde dehydrogenase [Halopenitus persicus]
MEAVNPATGEVIDSYQEGMESDIEAAISASTHAFDEWRNTSLRERQKLLANAADVLRDRQRELAELMTREMGKPITQAMGEIEKCAWVCDHYAEFSSAYLSADSHPSPPGTTVKTRYDPLGVVLAVMPWNYPFWQVFRFAAPSLTAGNVALLKHASNVPGCALAIADVFREAGYPEDVFQTLLIPSDRVETVLKDDRVRAATLTGSGPAGRAVASTAGESLKKTVLELGGSDPFIVLDDADLDDAAETGAWARNMNGGQSCIAAKRFIVHEAVYDAFLEKLESRIESLVIGDPMDEETEIGPQASQHLMEDLHQQVEESVSAGANLLTGGQPLDRDGAFYPPTILTDIPAECPADSEELFGPVASVFKVTNEQEAVAKANETRFGLGASIWTEDRGRGERIAAEVDAGCTYINQLTKSDPRVPFGGVKDSGYGRELSEAGIKEFVNRKTVWVE